ncbi:FlgD immunoglobulin-like domain containing protein, partial [Candidatus Eisenbacteria bacterium]
QPITSLIHYYLTGQDIGGHGSSDPANPPMDIYAFWVLQALMSDDMEVGVGSWTHYEVTDGYSDQWHHSSQRNHTGGGTWSWKFGDTGGGDYADMTDGALESEAFNADEGGTLTFWHWMDAETSGSYPGHAYDGGFVEISVDGGPWTQIMPEGGYPYLVVEGSGPGPFPPETPFYSGSFDWTKASFDLTGISGSLRVRFRFGSDGAVTGEGWYIDDAEFVPTGPGYLAADDPEPLPNSVALHQNTPNPFRGDAAGTLIHFDLPQADRVRLQLFDPSGRLVRTLVDGGLAAGRYHLLWDGRDTNANSVSSGVYFCILQAGGQRHARELLLVR